MVLLTSPISARDALRHSYGVLYWQGPCRGDMPTKLRVRRPASVKLLRFPEIGHRASVTASGAKE
jgi:hypothetical protein